MAEITDLSGISADPVTPEQIHGMIQKIDVAIYNIVFGNGTFGGLDIKELGPAGHESEPSKLLAELRALRKMYVDMLNNPGAMGDNVIVRSEWDNPDL